MNKVFRVLTNKFLLTTVAFLAWIIYFDQNDWISQQQRLKELNAVKANITYLNAEIAQMNTEHTQLLTNPSALEKYARENFRMKRDGEDVYVIDKGK